MVTGIVAAAIAVGAATGRIRRPLGATPALLIPGLLAVWVVAGGVLHGRGSAALPAAIAVVGLTAVWLLARSATLEERTLLLDGLTAVGVLVALSGWVGIAWHHQPWGQVDRGLWRAATTLTYENAAAGLLVPLALLAVALLATEQLNIWRRRVTALSALMLLLGSVATMSRAGALALLAGTAVLALTGSRRQIARAALAPALGMLVAFVALLPSLPAHSSPRPLTATVGLVAGAAVTLTLLERPRLAARATVAVAVAVLATVALHSGTRQAVTDVRAHRLTVASSDRAGETRAAWQLASENLVTGVGAGPVELVWRGSDGVVRVNRYAHNEYLQTLVETGLVGLALLLLAAAAAARALWLARRRVLPAGAWAGAVAGLAAIAVHSGFDFLWHVPVIPLIGALLAGLATPNPEESTAW